MTEVMVAAAELMSKDPRSMLALEWNALRCGGKKWIKKNYVLSIY